MAKNSLTTSSEETKARQLALEQMNEELRKEFEEIAQETQKQAHGNVLFYHKLGMRARKIHADEQKYGEGAIDKLATALTLDRGLIYKAMTFAEQFSKDELKSLMERRTSGDNYITWSHFSQLVVLEDKKVRDDLVEFIFKHDLSVRDLRDELRKRIYSGSAGQRQASPRTLMGGLSQMLTMGSKLVQKFANEFEDSVFTPLERLESDQITDEVLKRVAHSEKTLKDLAEQSAAKAKEMEKLRAKLAKQLEIMAKAKEKAEKEASRQGESRNLSSNGHSPGSTNGHASVQSGSRVVPVSTAKRSRRPIEA